MYPIHFRFHGEEDDRMSVASRKMTAYAKTDCVGASKGLFFGLLTLVLGVISLVLFFVLIDHDNREVRKLTSSKTFCYCCRVVCIQTFAFAGLQTGSLSSRYFALRNFARFYLSHLPGLP